MKKMKIEIETDGEEVIPTNPKPAPTDFTSRAVKLRLMMLFGMLILVVILMKEAGKPENWKWMGFDQQPVAQTKGADANSKGTSPHDVKTDSASVADNSVAEPAGERSLKNEAALAGSSAGNSSATPSAQHASSIAGQANDYPSAARKFWVGLIPRFSAQQRRDLFRLIKGLRNMPFDPQLELSSDPKIADYQELVDLIAARRNKFHSEMFDQLAVLPDGNEGKEKLAREFFDSQQVWGKKIFPAFKSVLAGRDFSISQLKRIEQLQLVLDPIMLDQVKDRTSIGWEGDSTAWFRLWERVRKQELEPPIPVTHLQLLSQSGFYRGKAVEVSGWVRSARRKDLQDSELGVSHYYEMWVRPADTNLAPYNIYSLELPDEFPELTDQFQKTNVRIKAAGAFLKVRTYIDGAVEVAESPVILAKNFESFNDSSPFAVSAWKPSRTTVFVLLILIPLVATAIAWLAHRGTQTQPYRPGAKTAKKIDNTLTQLTNDPDVKTDRERVLELYQADADDH